MKVLPITTFDEHPVRIITAPRGGDLLLLTENEAKEQHRQEPSLSAPRAPKPPFYRPRERVKRGQRKEREPVCTGWCSLLRFRGMQETGNGESMGQCRVGL